MPLTGIAYGRIDARYIDVVGDGTDTDRDPDVVPVAGGEITFTPSAAVLLHATADPPATVRPQRVTCTTDADGYLLGPDGQRGVWLLPTDDERLNPVGWTYRVAYGKALSSLPAFPIAVPSGSTQDLSVLTPVPASGGQAIVVGPAGPSVDDEQVQAAVADYLTANPPAGGGEVDLSHLVDTDDPRLSDARTPTEHQHAAAEISDSTPVGRALMTTSGANPARATLGVPSQTQHDAVDARVAVLEARPSPEKGDAGPPGAGVVFLAAGEAVPAGTPRSLIVRPA